MDYAQCGLVFRYNTLRHWYVETHDNPEVARECYCV